MGDITDKMRNKIMQADSIDSFADSDMLRNEKLAEYIGGIIAEKKLKKADIARNSGLERTYVYHLLNGDRVPSRDKLIALAFGMGLTPDEMDELMKVSGNMPLYSRNKRDALIIFSLKSSESIIDLNISLDEQGLEIVK